MSKKAFRAKNTILHPEKEKTEKNGEYLKAWKRYKKREDNIIRGVKKSF